MEGERARAAWKDIRWAVVVMTAAGAFAVASSTVLSANVSQIVSDHLMTALPLLAAVFSFFVARNHSGRIRTAWILLGCWGTLSAAGNGLWSYYELVAKTDPFPSFADVGYLGGNLCAVAAMVVFAVGSLRSSRFRTFLDALVIAGSVFIISWTLALEAVVKGSGGSKLEAFVGLAYPVIDVMIVSLVVFVATRTHGPMRIPILLAGIGFIGWAFADTAFGYLSLIGTYKSGGPVDAGWIGGDALIALAAFTAMRMRRFDQTEDGSVRSWRLHLPYFVAGAAVIVGSISGVLGNEIEPVETFAIFALLLLVVVRQFFMVLETQSVTIERMRSVDNMKNGILRAVSHELRTPLTVIEGVADLLADEGIGGNERRDLVDRLQRNSHRLKTFLSGLLDLERLSRGVLEPELRRVELSEVLERIADTVRIDSHTICVVGAEVWANIDVGQVERAVENILVNVQRHTPHGTTAVAEAHQTSDGVLITVTDDGPGIPEDRKESIFTPFARETADVARGTGIGLALVASIARVHGGRAWVEDVSPHGARFAMLLRDQLAQSA